MSVKKQMMQARQLIEAKKYKEAYAILRKIDHPKAKEWMGKIEPRLKKAKTQSSRTSSSKKSAKTKSSKKSGTSPIVLVLGVIMTVILLGGVAFIAMSLLGDDSAPAQTEQIASSDDADENSENAESMTEDEGQPEAAADMAGPIVGPGQRMVMFERFNIMLTAELPQGWICDCTIASINIEPPTDSRDWLAMEVASHAFDPDYFLDKTVEEAITERLRDDETLVSQESIQVGGREVYKVVIADEDGEESIDYLTKDSDGHVVIVVIHNWMDDKESLDEAALFIASNAEAIIGAEAEENYNLLTADSYGQDAATGRWYLPDVVHADQQLSVEMADGWAIGPSALGLPMAIKNDSAETSATAFVYLTHVFGDEQSLEEVVTEFVSGMGETIQSIETVQANGREVIVTIEIDPEGDNATTMNFYTLDSDNDLVVAIIQPGVVDKDALRNDVLTIVSTLEAEEVVWEDRLRQVGLLEES